MMIKPLIAIIFFFLVNRFFCPNNFLGCVGSFANCLELSRYVQSKNPLNMIDRDRCT